MSEKGEKDGKPLEERLKEVPWGDLVRAIDKVSELIERVFGSWGKNVAPIRSEEIRSARHTAYLTYAALFATIAAASFLAWQKTVSGDAVVGLFGAVVGYLFGKR